MALKTDYRVTVRRPVGGRMRKVGDVVSLTKLEAECELTWGGLEPVEADAVTVEPAAETGAGEAATETASDTTSARKRKAS